MAAAQRMATKYNMSIEEAANSGNVETSKHPATHEKQIKRTFNYDFYAGIGSKTDIKNHEKEKASWLAAVKKAEQRGLNSHLKKDKKKHFEYRRINQSRRTPLKHARILLSETGLSFQEIADITELDVYKIVGIKLKSRGSVYIRR